MTCFHPLFGCLQVSEHASWSSLYYGRIIKAALASVGRIAAQLQIQMVFDVMFCWFCLLRLFRRFLQCTVPGSYAQSVMCKACYNAVFQAVVLQILCCERHHDQP